MAEKRYIKHLYEEKEQSLRAISRITGLSQQTVAKYAYQSKWDEDNLPNCQPDRYPVLGPFIATIDGWLENDRREPRKQRHTVTRIYKRLQEEHGFRGSYSSVKKYVRKKRFLMKTISEGYLPLSQPPAHAQVDFGDFKYYDSGGASHKGHALIVSFPYSNSGWMQVFRSENQECLLEGLKNVFYHIGGVPVRLRCDNMATAVAHMLQGTDRELTDGFARFMLQHRFAADFCNPDSGNEKGNVENKVGYTRRNMLVPVPVIDDFEAFNKELLTRCDADHGREHYRHGDTLEDRWEQEKKCLLTLPEYEYDVFRYESVTVSKTGFATVDKSKYGLSPELSGKIVQAKLYYDRIRFFYDRQLLTTYERSYEKNKEVSDWKQYLPTLVRKPGGVEHTQFFDQMPKLWQAYLKTTKGSERKSALTLLMEIVEDGNEALCDNALELAGEYGRLDNDSIRQCYLLLSKPENRPAPLVLTSNPPLLNYDPDLSVYDKLVGGEAV
ncbi:MAG: IS21 family transposase [Betaproteobacteria bacterium]|nr:IS21 family transposase [Betaproteobacteria bacterium]